MTDARAMTATAEASWDAIVVTAQSLEVASAVASELRAATPDTLVLGVPDPGERAGSGLSLIHI